jgi:hypothetical protein
VATRFNAAGQEFTRAPALGAQPAFTVTCWVHLTVNRVSWSTIWSFDNTATDRAWLGTSSTGNRLYFWDEVGLNDNTGPTLATGVWTFVGVAVNGANGSIYYRDSSTTLSTSSWTTGNTTLSMQNLTIGTDLDGSWLNGRVAALKIWTATLTQAEIDAESWQYVPARGQDLRAWYPLAVPEPGGLLR